jgi:hypothetical protein
MTRNPVGATYCPLVPAQGCFDTGQPTRVRFEDAGGGLAWSVEVLNCDGSSRHMIWPSSCGAPTVESEDPIVCANLRRIDGTSLGEPLGLHCSAPRLPEGVTLARNSGCVGAWPPEGALTVVANDDAPVINVGATAVPTPAAPDPVPDAPAADVAASAPRVDDTSNGCSLGPAPTEPITRWVPAALGALGLLLGRHRRGSRAGIA